MNDLVITGVILEPPEYHSHPGTESVIHGKIVHKIPFMDEKVVITLDFISFGEYAGVLNDAKLHEQEKVSFRGPLRPLEDSVMVQVTGAGIYSCEDKWVALS